MPSFSEFHFPSHDGSSLIRAAEWLPDGSARAVVQISHGVAEHIERYNDFAAFLCRHGIAVLANDHIGHGLSVAEGQRRVYLQPGRGWWDAVDDLHTLRREGGRRFTHLPYFLLGHSMGSFLARSYLIRYPGSVYGAILMGTGQQSAALIAAGRLAAQLEGRRIGFDRGSDVIEKLAFGAYNRRFSPNRTTHDWLSRNGENVDRYLADPLCGSQVTAGLFYEMLGGLDFIRREENVRKMDISRPVLFVSGWEDPVGEMGKGVIAACNTFRAAGVKDLNLQLYPAMRHEILNEDRRETVYDDLLRWIEERI